MTHNSSTHSLIARFLRPAKSGTKRRESRCVLPRGHKEECLFTLVSFKLDSECGARKPRVSRD